MTDGDVPMKSGSNDLPITIGAQLTRDTTVDTDVCVIGSGCGGASLACRLAEAGVRVVVVEQGGYWGSRDFDQRELHMLAKIDGGRGLDTSVDGSAAFTYGNNVGGASVHYWADSYRTPEDRLQQWAERFGVTGHGAVDLAPHFDQIERDLHVHVTDDGFVNTMNAKLHEGATALGWDIKRVPQARKGCVRSGHCMQGCAYDAKQSQLVTYLPRALAAGAQVFADVRAVQLTSTGPALTGRTERLECVVVDRATGLPTGVRLTVKAKAFVVAAGGLSTPELLLRQAGLKARLPHLGEHFFCNPCAQVHAVFDEDIVQWRNIPAAWGVEQFRLATTKDGSYVEGGYLLMANQLHPATLAACLLVDGARQREIMRGYKKLGGTIAWIDDADVDCEGRVWLEGDRRRVQVPLDGGNGRRLRDAFKKQAQLLFRVGAKEVFFGDVHDTRLTRVDQIDDAVARLDLRPARHVLAAPHPGGAARMGTDPATSVVGVDHRVHGSDNVYVADPSVLPTPPSMDPSLTIMAFSFVAADVIRGRL